MKKEITYIYALIDPRNGQVRYIGKANDPKQRKYCHINEKTTTRKANWIKNLKTNGYLPVLEIIDKVKKEEWQFWEMHYISLYRSWNFDLTNHTLGGEGCNVISEETREKMRLHGKQTKHSEEEKQKRRERMLEFKHSVKSVKKMKQNRRLYLQGLSLQEINTNRSRYAEKFGRQVVQYDLQGSKIREMESSRAAARIVNGCDSLIRACCVGKRFTGYKSVWRYINPQNDELPNTVESVLNSVSLKEKI